jgi:translation initiation factor IF-1
VDSDGEGSAGRPTSGRGASLNELDGSGESKDEQVADVTGVVMETLPSALYKVRLDEGSLVLAHIADRMDRNFVRILVGDRVRLALSPTDVGRGRIVEKI